MGGRIDVLGVLDEEIGRAYGDSYPTGRALIAARIAVAELLAAAEDARSALHSCIDALSSDEQDDHDALARVTSALASIGATP